MSNIEKRRQLLIDEDVCIMLHEHRLLMNEEPTVNQLGITWEVLEKAKRNQVERWKAFHSNASPDRGY